MSRWEMGRQQQRALMSWSSDTVAVAGGASGAASTCGAIALVVVGGVACLLLTISNSSSGELRDGAEPSLRHLGPRVFAVALDVARGAVAQTVLELDVHVVFDALVCDRGLGGDLILLLGVDVEDVVEPP